MLDVLIAILCGVLSGIITGLIPGIHVNLISVLLLSFSPLLLPFTGITSLLVYIISLSITHSFLDSIPSIYLGAPDAGQELNVLPGHRLLHQGMGHSAILYTVIGSLGTLLLGIIFFPLFMHGMKIIYPILRDSIGILLIIIMSYMVLKDKGKRIKSLAFFLISGSLGLLVFGIPTLSQPLFPLLSGLFGVSIILDSFAQTSSIPNQQPSSLLTLTKTNLQKALGAATGVGFIAAFLPGFGSSQAAIVATNIVGDIGDEGFLTLVGGINTANFLLSIATVHILEKARNGAIVVVRTLIGEVTLEHVFLFLSVALIVGGVATLLAIFLSKQFAKYIVKVNYKIISLCIIGFITLLTCYFDGIYGLMILITATSIGLSATKFGIGKNHLMGCLILPVILYFIL